MASASGWLPTTITQTSAQFRLLTGSFSVPKGWASRTHNPWLCLWTNMEWQDTLQVKKYLTSCNPSRGQSTRIFWKTQSSIIPLTQVKFGHFSTKLVWPLILWNLVYAGWENPIDYTSAIHQFFDKSTLMLLVRNLTKLCNFLVATMTSCQISSQ